MLLLVPIALAETWSENVSLDQDLTVAEGDSLTIDAGVTVTLGTGVSLVVEGELVARGTPDAPITFTGDRWGSVFFADTSVDAVFEDVDEYTEGSILEHVVFEGGSRAVWTEGASPYVVDCIFQDNVFEPDLADGGAAMYLTYGSEPRVRGCRFLRNVVMGDGQGGAVFVLMSDPVLQDNLFQGNSSTYGGALTTALMYGPIVGNTFEGNASDWEGGGMALVSSSLALLNNTVVSNSTGLDGGGVHVCVTCYPHSAPVLIDNTVTGNTNLALGAAGVGAAFLHGFSHNDIHDNTQNGEPADLAWHNEELDAYEDWACNLSAPDNWWGTTDSSAIARTIFDGSDEPGLGLVDFEPPASASAVQRLPRATVTTDYLRYEASVPMRVNLTLYNPGEAGRVELHLLYEHDGLAAVPYRGEIDYPGAEYLGDGAIALTLPDDSAWFDVVLQPAWDGRLSGAEGAWHALLFDPDTGERIGDDVVARFEYEAVP